MSPSTARRSAPPSHPGPENQPSAPTPPQEGGRTDAGESRALGSGLRPPAGICRPAAIAIPLIERRRRFAALAHTWEALLAAIREESPHLDARLRGAEACSARPLALSSIPYGYIRRRADGLFRLGDQAAVIPSFAGDGMAIALHSAALAAQTHLAGRDADSFQRRLARDVTPQVLLATGLSHGLVRRPTQVLLAAVARMAPGLVATIAARTRVSDAALARTRMEHS